MPLDNKVDNITFSGNPHIVVVGAGAMGCYFGGMLINSGQKVTLIDIDKDQIDIINRQGLTLETDDGVCCLKAKSSLAEEVNLTADLIILFTKTMHSSHAMDSVKHLITKKTVVLSLQNGLGNIEKLTQYVDSEYVVIGTTLLPVDLKGVGYVRSNGPSYSKIMDASLKNPKWLSELVILLNKASLTSYIDSEILSAIWSKAAFNAALNSICAITGSAPGGLSAHVEFKKLARSVVSETVLIGASSGISMDETAIWGNVKMAIDEHSTHKPSMLQDLELGRLTEIDAINGAILDAAEKVGLEAPINKVLMQLIKLKEHLVI